ncbi:hypothetical protein VTO73DRAFT_11267 [Trametes versicolor]
MSSSESFNILDYVNFDMFEEDVPEKELETTEGSQTAEYDHRTDNSPHLCPSIAGPPLSLDQGTPQGFPPNPHFALFEDTTNAVSVPTEDCKAMEILRTITTSEAVALPHALGKSGAHVASSGEMSNEAEADGVNSFELTPRHCTYNKQPPLVANDYSPSLLPPASSRTDPSLVVVPQESGTDSSPARSTPGERSDKENVPPTHPSVDRRPTSQSQPLSPPVVPRRRRRAPEEQPVAGPSSVTLDDLASAESQGSDAAPERARTKRPRSTRDEVSAVQTTAHKADKCGLNGGECKHALTKDTTKNKQHIQEAHPSKIPSDAGTPTSTTGALYYKGKKALSDEDVRDHVKKGSLACTWATPGAARCGRVFSGDTPEASLARHVEENHWGREFACDKCTPRRRFGSLRALQAHMKKHDGAGCADLPKDKKARRDDGDGDGDEGKIRRPTKRRRVK